jgi:hypothetical protein
MPKLKRRAIERRRKPQLSAEVWRWLEAGMPPLPEEQIAGDLAWDIFMLPGRTGVPELTFWQLLKAKVESGDVEVVEGFQHRHNDPPLVIQKNDGQT